MTTQVRWVWITVVCLAIVGMAWGVAGAADKSKVDQATNQVERGAKQIGQGDRKSVV